MTGEGTVSSNKIGVANTPTGTMTLSGGKIVSATNYAVKNLGTMTIEDPTEITQGESNHSSVVANGWYSNVDTIDGVKYAAEPDKANLTINGGTITGSENDVSTAVKNNDYGNLTVNGGQLYAPGAYGIVNHNVAVINDGYIVGSTALFQSTYGSDADADQMTINGGVFESEDPTSATIADENDGGNGGTITINDGTFYSPVVAPKENTQVAVTGGFYYANDILDPEAGLDVADDVTVAKITGVDGSVTYVAGKGDVENAAKAARRIEVEQGDATIITYNEGTEVENEGNGDVTSMTYDEYVEQQESQKEDQKTDTAESGQKDDAAADTTAQTAANGATAKTSGTAAKTAGPNTGDTMNGALWVAILAACGVALGLVVRKKARE